MKFLGLVRIVDPVNCWSCVKVWYYVSSQSRRIKKHCSPRSCERFSMLALDAHARESLVEREETVAPSREIFC
jgi:hypothetical protein